MMASGGGQVNTGPVNKPPPIDDERRSRSPGLRNNFYDVPQSDFKRPWGSRGPVPPTDAPPNGTPLPQPPAGYGAPALLRRGRLRGRRRGRSRHRRARDRDRAESRTRGRGGGPMGRPQLTTSDERVRPASSTTFGTCTRRISLSRTGW